MRVSVVCGPDTTKVCHRLFQKALDVLIGFKQRSECLRENIMGELHSDRQSKPKKNVFVDNKSTSFHHRPWLRFALSGSA